MSMPVPEATATTYPPALRIALAALLLFGSLDRSLLAQEAISLMAGVGRADITPPPGLPMFGYSRAGSGDAEGVRTRLYARVLYLEDSAGRQLAVVQCDLGGISPLLPRRIADRLKTTGLTRDEIVVVATHTHGGPGGYFADEFYNDWGSNRSGFDSNVATFLSDRISEAVLQAHRSRARAALAVGSTTARGLTLNRSLPAFKANKNAGSPLYDSLTLLRVDRLREGSPGYPIAALTNFAIHGTAVPAANDLYHGDLHAAASRAVEHVIRRRYGTTGEDFVHLATNGAEGDVQPAYDEIKRDASPFSEAHRLGEAFGRQALSLFNTLESATTSRVDIASHFIDLRLRNPTPPELCHPAMVGVPVLGGSEEGRSHLHEFAKEGNRRESPEGCHASKKPAFELPGLDDALHRLLIKETAFPGIAPIQTFRINDVLFVALPGEVTTEMGRRIRDAARSSAAEVGLSVKSVALLGLAGAYISYVSTPEEYEQQHYEGASTFYGPGLGPFLQGNVARLVRELALPSRQPVFVAESGIPGGASSLIPPKERFRTDRKAEHDAEVQIDRSSETACAVFEWRDMRPGSIEFHRSLVRVEQRQGDSWVTLEIDGVPVNDEGLDIEIRHTGHQARGASGWRTSWCPSSATVGVFRILIEPRRDPFEPGKTHGAIVSKEFRFVNE
jgi:neutral ceramidase